MSDFLPVYSDSDSDADVESFDKLQKESTATSATESVAAEVVKANEDLESVDAVSASASMKPVVVPVSLPKWMNPEDSSTSSSEDEGNHDLRAKSAVQSKKQSNSVKPSMESSISNPNSLQTLMNAVKDRPSFLQSKIKEKFQIESIKRHDYDHKKENGGSFKAVEQQNQPTVASSANVSENVVSIDDSSVKRGELKSAAHNKADSRKDAKLRKAEADKETAKVTINKC